MSTLFYSSWNRPEIETKTFTPENITEQELGMPLLLKGEETQMIHADIKDDLLSIVNDYSFDKTPATQQDDYTNRSHLYRSQLEHRVMDKTPGEKVLYQGTWCEPTWSDPRGTSFAPPMRKQLEQIASRRKRLDDSFANDNDYRVLLPTKTNISIRHAKVKTMDRLACKMATRETQPELDTFNHSAGVLKPRVIDATRKVVSDAIRSEEHLAPTKKNSNAKPETARSSRRADRIREQLSNPERLVHAIKASTARGISDHKASMSIDAQSRKQWASAPVNTYGVETHKSKDSMAVDPRAAVDYVSGPSRDQIVNLDRLGVFQELRNQSRRTTATTPQTPGALLDGKRSRHALASAIRSTLKGAPSSRPDTRIDHKIKAQSEEIRRKVFHSKGMPTRDQVSDIKIREDRMTIVKPSVNPTPERQTPRVQEIKNTLERSSVARKSAERIAQRPVEPATGNTWNRQHTSKDISAGGRFTAAKSAIRGNSIVF